MSEVTYVLIMTVISISSCGGGSIESDAVISSGLHQYQCEEERLALTSTVDGTLAELPTGTSIYLQFSCKAEKLK